MNKANECTCPSGDGSLVHPCPAHPAVEQADVAAKLTFINGRPAMCGCQVEYSDGGGEYSDVIYVTLCAKHSGSAILDLVATNRIALTPEYEGQWHADLYLDREIPLAKVEGATPAEAVLALMSAERIDPEQESVEQAGGDEHVSLRGAANLAFNALHECVPAGGAEKQYSDAIRALETALRDIAYSVNRTATPQQFSDHLQREARAALAQPSPVRSSLLINGYQLRAALDFIAPDGTAEQLKSEACIEWRQQDADFLEAGLYAFCAEYPEEGGVLLDEEPTNSQPSPAQELAERGTQHRFSTTEQTCRHDFAGVWWNDNGETKTGKECRECGFFIADIAEAPELERPEVVGYLATAEHPEHGQPHKAFNYFKDQHDAQVAHWRERGCTVTEDRLMTVAQHERIVGELRADRDSWAEQAEQRLADWDEMRKERDAALARVAELERQEPVALANRGNQGFWVEWTEAAAGLYGSGIKLYAAPVARAQHSVPDGYRLIRLEHFAAIKAQLDPEQVDAYRGRNIYDEDKVYANWNACRSALDEIKDVFQQIDWDAENELAELLAAAPGKEVPQAWLDVQAERRRQVEVEGYHGFRDNHYISYELSKAARAYIEVSWHALSGGLPCKKPESWPWMAGFKWSDGRTMLVKACALVLAEIERLDRAAHGKEVGHE
ncbi:TPA: hypothetical protein NH997_001008 [Pseudomonas aeruginosa]|nr:hypothetical protein [Pseudomonas aeruginosa]